MDDQGEKIVFLAREILNAGMPESGAAKKTLTITMSFKTLCLTTFLAAAGGGGVTAAMHESARPLDRYERTEINALLFYAAKIKGLDEDNLRHDVEKQIGISHFDEMSASEFPTARKYLQEKAQ